MEKQHVPARYMSTHAIKSELATVLAEMRPRRTWSKRATLAEMSACAIAEIDDKSTDTRCQRALELAHVLYDDERR
jgi:hypothetical protein